MGNIGPMELIVVLVIALVVLGPKRLPEVGKSLGRSMREFKGAVSGEHDDEPDVAFPVVTPAQAVEQTKTETPQAG